MEKSTEIKGTHTKQQIKLAVDNCIFTIKDDKLYVLLIKMKAKFPGQWALPGGLIKGKETAEQAASRILKEQTGVSNVYLEQLRAFSKINRDPFGRVVSIAYFALIPTGDIKLKPGNKYSDVKWCEFLKLPGLAYDHNDMAKYAKKRLEAIIAYSNIAWSLLPRQFTLTQLQKVYEAIIGKNLDKRNFRKKIIKMNLINAIGEKSKSGACRPAELYQFKLGKSKNIRYG